MAAQNFAFAGGLFPSLSYGTKAKIRFVNTWAATDDWTLPMVGVLVGAFTLGKGNISEQTYTSGYKLRNRMYLGFGSSFALSSNGDVTKWEQQNPGAAVIPYLSQYGQQDTVQAFAATQGRIAVYGRTSIQVWGIDADPANFVLQQTMDNSGTQDPLSVKSIGDWDVLYLDSSGIRSLKTKENFLNAYVSDIGSAIDLLVRTDLISYTPGSACAIVEPLTRQYWLYLNEKIYVLSDYPTSNIVAWSTYRPTAEPPTSGLLVPSFATYQAPGSVTYTVVVGSFYRWIKAGTAIELRKNDSSVILSATGVFQATETTVTEMGTTGQSVLSSIFLAGAGVTFTPTKMVVFNGQIYIRASSNKIYKYGGASNNSFDSCQATVELPWLDLKEPSMRKQMEAIDVAFKGHWTISTSVNPRATSYVVAVDRGSQTVPSMVDDSTFDVGRFPVSGNGTHIKVKATSVTDIAAKLGKINVIYKAAGDK